MTPADVQPGDYAVIDTQSPASPYIDIMERLSGGGASSIWNHAVICTRVVTNPLTGTRTVMIMEAEPGGAVERPWHYQANPHKWSTGILPPCPQAGEAALLYDGTPYSFLDYATIAAHAWHIPAPGLRAYVASTRSMICSQLADQSRLDGGSHLFDDGRWPGFVRPCDLGALLA
jgi:hypothetical protein